MLVSPSVSLLWAFNKSKVTALINFPLWLSGGYCSAELNSTIVHFLQKLCAYSLETMH